MKPSRVCALGLVFGGALCGQAAFAEARDAAAWTAHVAGEYDITPNVTYLVAGDVDLKAVAGGSGRDDRRILCDIPKCDSSQGSQEDFVTSAREGDVPGNFS